MVDDISGVFVAPTGNDGLGGSRSFPVQSIGTALDRAMLLGRTTLYLAPGVFAGNVTVRQPISLLAGWSVNASTWRRDCTADARVQTVILALDGGPALAVVDAGVLVRSLSVQTLLGGTSAPNTPGASRVGVWARNATLTLDDVEVLATDGLPGGVASSGSDGAPAMSSCAGACSSGAAALPLPATPGSDGGTFSASGFTPGDGLDGLSGGNGQNGSPGGAGATVTGCYSGCGCGVGCASQGPATVAGPTGWCGCGGRGGAGGSRGRGGGASIGLYAVNSTVRLTKTVVSAGRGGAGSAGGAGGVASLGSDGGSGSPASCQTKPCRVTSGSCAAYPNVACYYGNGPSDEVVTFAAAGAPGGSGGRGANGQAAGSGAGGPSVAVVLSGSSLSLDGGSTLRTSAGGVGGPGAENGLSANTVSLP